MYDEDFKFALHYEKLFATKWNTICDKEIVHVNKKDDADFIIGKKSKLELKVDRKLTGNYFIELIKNVRKNLVGGPEQAKEYGSKYFAFWFINFEKDNLFIFNNNELVKWININRNSYRSVLVNNGEYQTSGIVVPRKELDFVIIKTIKVEENEKYGNKL